MHGLLHRTHRTELTKTSAASIDTTHAPEPTIFVIFGITGNLAQKRLLPALYHLIKDNLLDERTAIVGVSRKELSTDELLSKVELCVLEADKACDPAVLKKFRERLHMVRLNPIEPADYSALHSTLQDIEDAQGVCMNRLFYLSIPPQVYAPVIELLGTHKLNASCKHGRAVSRLLVEKPFGYDLTSAKELIKQTARYFNEQQVFRIDHYLAKETAQNILVFRADNPLFNNAWSHQHISSIDLEFREQIGVEGRSEFYDNIGALRDVVQNHVLQLLALATMELPGNMDSAAIHRSKQALFRDIRPSDPYENPVVRGQYDGYQQEVSNPGSTTETYVRLHLEIDNQRWRGVPITLSAGKALDTKRTTITVTFNGGEQANQLTFRIQPDEGIGLALAVKVPGFSHKTQTADMNFSYEHTFGNTTHPDAYERVLIDAVKGDHSLFATSEEVLESWRILQPVLDYWGQGSDDLRTYKPGTAGPIA